MTVEGAGRQQAHAIFDDAVPSLAEVAETVAHLQINWTADRDELPVATDAALETLAADLRRRKIPLTLAVKVHRENWIHVRGWLRRARRLTAEIRLDFVPSSSPESLAHLDGSALSLVRTVLTRWLRETDAAGPAGAIAERSTSTLLGQWQRASASLVGPHGRLTLPAPEHSLVSDETALEQLLIDLLRVYDRPEIEDWLHLLVRTDGFAAAARSRRSFRVALLWLYGVFRRTELLPVLATILETPEDARALLHADVEALRDTPMGPWLDGWRQQLRLATVRPRDRHFPSGTVVPARAGSHSRTTVVIPAFNHERFVVAALDSVLAQSRDDFELLVIDDGSSDGTVNAVRTVADPRIRVLQNEQNVGLGRSLARALDSVRTEFVAVLNSDDLFHPDRLMQAIGALESRAGVDVVATGLLPIDAAGRVYAPGESSPVFEGLRVAEWLDWYWRSAPVTIPLKPLQALLERNFLVTSSNLVARTDFLREHQREWESLEFCVDWQLFLLAAMADSLFVVPDALLGYRLHPSNTVWFDELRGARYYVEANRVAAQALERIAAKPTAHPERARELLDAMVTHLSVNTNVDWAGVLLTTLLDRAVPVDDPQALSQQPHLAALIRSHAAQVEREQWLRDLGVSLRDVARLQGEAPYLRSLRNQYEPLVDEHRHLGEDYERLRGDYARLEADTAEFRSRSVRADRLIAHIDASGLGHWLLDGVRLRRPLLAFHRVWLAWRNGS